MRVIFLLFGGALALSCLLADGALAATAGTIEFVSGEVQILSPSGQARAARLKESVGEGDTVITGGNGELHLVTMDFGLLAVRPNTRMRIDAYRAGTEDSILLSLLEGTFRSVTGWIGRRSPDRYRVKTPTATIGIRGTDHEPLYLASSTEHPGRGGTYDKVNQGATVLENAAGRLELSAGRVGFAPERNEPVLLDGSPSFYRPTPNEPRIDARKPALERQRDEQLKQQEQRGGRSENSQSPAESGRNSTQPGGDRPSENAVGSDAQKPADLPDTAARQDKPEMKDRPVTTDPVTETGAAAAVVRPETPARVDKAARVEQERNRPDRPEQAVKSEKVERAERVKGVERAERPEKVQRVERPDKVERVERPDKVERAERPDKVERVERPDKVERAERPERIERIERPERVERVERPHKIERLDRPDRPDKVDRHRSSVVPETPALERWLQANATPRA